MMNGLLAIAFAVLALGAGLARGLNESLDVRRRRLGRAVDITTPYVAGCVLVWSAVTSGGPIVIICLGLGFGVLGLGAGVLLIFEAEKKGIIRPIE
jgi:hypothetical protein